MGLFEREFQLSLYILASTSASARGPRATPRAKHFLKNVEAAASAKRTEIKVFEIDATSSWSTCGSRSLPSRRRRAATLLNGFPILTILVIKLSIFMIRENVVSFL
jgi:hypothetical protein